MEFLKSDTFRRILAGLVGVVLPVLNKKLGLDIPQEQVVAAIGLVAVYIAQSVANAMHARHVEAVTTGAEAAKVLAGSTPVVTKADP